jgi:hypothetical protein
MANDEMMKDVLEENQDIEQTINIEGTETVAVDVDEVLVSLSGDGSQFNHALLNNRELSDQHPITAITGLQEELNEIKSLQTVYSDKKQQADYYLWHQDEEHILPSDPYGLFV